MYEDFGDDTGGLVIPVSEKNQPFIDEIRSLITKKLGGFTEVTAEGYLEAKKAASAEQQRRQQLDATLQGTQYSKDPRLVGPAGGKPVAAHIPGLAIGVSDVLPKIEVTAPDSGRIKIPAPQQQLEVPSADGLIHRTSIAYPPVMTTEEYVKAFGGSVPKAEPAPAEEKVVAPPRVGRKRV